MLNKPSAKSDLLLLFLGIGLFFYIGLGARPYLTPSEARYIEIPRQMLVSGDWLTPHINGVQYFEKPPLFYWLQAIFLSLGAGEFWGRIATALVVTLTCLITYATGRLLYGRACGLLAAGALATSVLGYGLSRIAMLDAPVSLFLTCSIASFIAAQKTGEKKFYYFMYAAAALAVMTKGLIGIVIPGLVIGSWIMITGNWKILKSARLFTGTLLFLAIAAPWHILMAIEHPEFFDFYFIHEHFTRFLTNEHKRTAPWWFFIAVTFAGALPWILTLLPLPLAGEGRGGGAPAANPPLPSPPPEWGGNFKNFLLLWILLPLIFFSLSHSKLVPYIFPIFPPIFILIGNRLSQWWELPYAPRTLRINALLMAVIAIGGFAGYSFFAPHPKLPILPFYGILPLLLVATALLAAAIIKKTPAKTLIAWLMVFGAALGLTANSVAGYFDQRTIKPLAEILNRELQENDMVVAYNSYWQDLPVYLDRNVTIAGWTGELGFGVEHTPDAKSWIIGSQTFWQECAEAKNNVYVFVNAKDLQHMEQRPGCRLRELSRYGKTILLEKDIIRE